MITALNGVIASSIASVSYDADAQLFFNAEAAAGVSLTLTQKSAVNQWVVDAKAAGIWTKMKAVYPMVGGTATAHKFNLKNPLDTDAAFRLNFVGGWTHSSNGALPNGTNAYANTFLSTSQFTGLPSGANGHLSYYSRTNLVSASVRIDIGTLKSTPDSYSDLVLGSSNLTYFRFNNAIAYDSVSASTSLGFYIGCRTFNTIIKTFRNGAIIINGTAPSNATSGVPFFIGASNNNGTAQYFSDKQCAFASLGDGLTDLESQLFYQITEKYQVALGRNVNALQSFYYNPAYNNETNAFLFSTQITDNTIQTATNTLVSDLKTAGVFTKMKALYPMVGGTATTHKFNLINAQDTNAAFRLSFVGGWTHSANGALPNGTNAYANTFLWHSAYLQRDNISLSNYIRTTPLGGIMMGTFGVTAGANAFSYVATATTTTTDSAGQANATNYNPALFTDTLKKGYYFVSRILNTEYKYYQNGLIKSTKLNNSSAYSDNINQSIYIGALNNFSGSGGAAYYCGSECAFATIGDGLTDAEALALYNAVNSFQVSLGRNV